jgi:NAD(P)-dependent dehydrogenase (short-subunit alcohol dehydrogenase family)
MKTILVTGANKGIGYEIVKELAEMGHRVYLTSRDKQRGLEATKTFTEAGLNVEFKQVDVSQQPLIEKLAEDFTKEEVVLDVLINNAGIYENNDHYSLVDIPLSYLDEFMTVNFKGPLMMTRAMLPFLQKSSDPRVVNMSSGMGALSGMGYDHPAYRISKAALNAQTAVLAGTLPDISINTMCPGWVQTDMGGSSAPRTVEQGADTAVWLATGDDVPSGKFLKDRQEIDW